MPYKIRKNPNQNTYKVTSTESGKVYAYKTKDPKQLIMAVEIAKNKKTRK
jgi:hypothetical protein